MSEKMLVTKAWEHAETHGNGPVLKRLAGGLLAWLNDRRLYF